MMGKAVVRRGSEGKRRDGRERIGLWGAFLPPLHFNNWLLLKI